MNEITTSATDKVTGSAEMLNDSPRLAGTEQRWRKDDAVKWNVVFSHEIVQLHLVFQTQELTIKLFTRRKKQK